jgi:membrane-associated phospholipid phosphatase
MEGIQEIGIAFIQQLQTLSPTLDPLMEFLSFLGTFYFMMFFIPLIYWLFDKRTGLNLLFLLLITGTLTDYFKQLLHQPRPYWLGEVQELASESAYGLPSAHASNTLALFGYLMYRIRKTWAWVVGSLLIFLIGISRMYLGVHFPSDVLAGWILGLIVLLLFIRFEKPVVNWWGKRSDAAQVGMGFLLSLVMILVGFLILGIISGTPDPQEWASFSTEARSAESYINYGGLFFGAICGIVCVRRWAAFKVDGAWWAKLLRFMVGMIGVGILYFGLDIAFALIAEDTSLLGMVLRYLRYAMAVYWVVFVAPWLFLKLKLAQPE